MAELKQWLDDIERIHQEARASEVAAFNAGRDARMNGANDENCHFKFFRSPALTAAWERGNAESERGAT